MEILSKGYIKNKELWMEKANTSTMFKKMWISSATDLKTKNDSWKLWESNPFNITQINV